ncbi:c-type cytochrome [Noviherbaspirillum denitrificans]|uniref:Cytochrome C n=1 Tax=Noviherbaspirillum denitrificans TaxID=1968433 RepID=A0A254TEH6_9BURK|nr:c-type cytochrome [Noviherbaspirillum denitrificans]OWW21056.1 cytochrome C [Noviherbaspirillum denitrificans]
MNKRQTRLFAIASTAIAALVFIGMTIDSHRQFPKLTNAQNITPAVRSGQDVWHKYNCINCHTLFGEGAYYAPDLTKITQLRGEQYLQAYMKDPSQFYDEQRHRRLMPKQNLSDEEIKNLIAFLDWIGKVDNQGWPPRPILVTGATIPGTDMTAGQQADTSGQKDAGQLPPGARPQSGNENPIALGERLFRSATPACNACHSIAPGVNMAGPSLAGVASRAEKLIASPDYKGKAKDAAGYIRESITNPSAHIVPGAMYSANGVSFMPNTYGKDLKPEQIDHLAAYLATLK